MECGGVTGRMLGVKAGQHPGLAPELAPLSAEGNRLTGHSSKVNYQPLRQDPQAQSDK